MFASLKEKATKLDFYSGSMEAAAVLEDFLLDPPHLSFYRQSLEITVRKQPDFENPARAVLVHSPKINIKSPDGALGELES